MICSKPGCGTIVDGKKFCPSCGTPVNSNVPPQETPKVQEPAPVQETVPVQEPKPEINAVPEQPVHQEPPAPPVQPVQPVQPAQPAPQYQAPAQTYQAPQYQAPPVQQAPAQAYQAPAVNQIVSTGAWFGIMLLMVIPVVNIIMLIVWAASAKKKSLSNYAKATLIWIAVGIVLSILLAIVFAVLGGSLLASLGSFDIQAWIQEIIGSVSEMPIG